MLFNVQVLTNKKTTFFGGNSLSMIDYLIWPWFVHAIKLAIFASEIFMYKPGQMRKEG